MYRPKQLLVEKQKQNRVKKIYLLHNADSKINNS